MSDLYDAGNRLKLDPCNMNAINIENSRQVNYNVFNHRSPCSDPCDRVQRASFQSRNRNLIAWDGVGQNACEVDVDSSYKNDPKTMTHTKCRQQLHNRVFVAVPNLQRGAVLPSLESRIQSGQDTTRQRECDRIEEKSWNAFNPGLCGDWQDPSHVVQPWTWGGDSSRDIARSDEFLSGLGYQYDGHMWSRQN